MYPRAPLVLSLCLGLSLLFCLRGLLARLLLGCLLGFLLLASAPQHRLLHRWLHLQPHLWQIPSQPLPWEPLSRLVVRLAVGQPAAPGRWAALVRGACG